MGVQIKNSAYEIQVIGFKSAYEGRSVNCRHKRSLHGIVNCDITFTSNLR